MGFILNKGPNRLLESFAVLADKTIPGFDFFPPLDTK